MKKKSKRYKSLIKLKPNDKKLQIKELIDLVKNTRNSKFDESIDVSLRINLKQSKGGDFNLEQLLSFQMDQEKNKIAVLCEPDKITDG